jgi:hypothetical protein
LDKGLLVRDAVEKRVQYVKWDDITKSTTYRYSRVLIAIKRRLWSHSITLAACRLVFVAFTCHLILKRTGTTKDNLLSGMSLGGAGIGWARASMASVS